MRRPLAALLLALAWLPGHVAAAARLFDTAYVHAGAARQGRGLPTGLPGPGLAPGAHRRPSSQDSFNIKELSEYRLSVPVFRQFVMASRGIVTADQADPRLGNDPLFTREISVLDDAVAAAARVEARLKFEPRYAAAVRLAGLSAHDYAKFALALFAARMAHGFLASGAIRGVAKGVATENVAFVAEHEREITEVLRLLGVETPAAR